MKRLVRLTGTRFFLKADGTKTIWAEDACHFTSTIAAVAFRRKWNLTDTEIVLRSERPEDDVILQMGRQAQSRLQQKSNSL